MLKIGLTGGIGCGKSTVTADLANIGISIIDADKIAHEIVAPDTQALSEIITIFGTTLLQKNGFLNRNALKQQVFSDRTKLKQLEAILHPKIRQTIKKRLTETKPTSISLPYIVADIPLLIEKDYMDLFDSIVVVDCLPEQQIQRIKQRDKMNITTIQSIIKKQVSRQQRLKQATYIINNQGTKKELRQQIDALDQVLRNL
jgi:dephospho-CoA kinase